MPLASYHVFTRCLWEVDMNECSFLWPWTMLASFMKVRSRELFMCLVNYFMQGLIILCMIFLLCSVNDIIILIITWSQNLSLLMPPSPPMSSIVQSLLILLIATVSSNLSSLFPYCCWFMHLSPFPWTFLVTL